MRWQIDDHGNFATPCGRWIARRERRNYWSVVYRGGDMVCGWDVVAGYGATPDEALANWAARARGLSDDLLYLCDDLRLHDLF